MSKNIYILIGGGCHEGGNKDLLDREIEKWLNIKEVPTARVLIVPFAKQVEDWKATSEKYTGSVFARLISSGRISVSTVSSDPFSLKSELSSADVVFVPGGSELNLKLALSADSIPAEGKIIVAVSAGANYFSQSYYSNDRESVESGVGILPLSTICHFTPEKAEKIAVLASKSHYPVFPVGNDQFITIIH